MAKRGVTRIAAAAVIAAAAGAAIADVNTWVGDDSSGGGWGIAANWVNASGAAEAPSAGDVALIGGRGCRVAANDDDAALVSSLERIELGLWQESLGESGSDVVVMDFSTNVVLRCAVTGHGCFIKRGAGEMELASTLPDSSFVTYSRHGLYDVGGGGMRVEEGTLVLPQNTGMQYIWNLAPTHIAEGATVVTSVESDGTCYLYQLTGGGTLTNRSENAVTVYIGRGVVKQSKGMAIFSGKVTGNVSLLVNGCQGFTGTENDMTGKLMSYNGDGSADALCGLVGVGHFGMKGSGASSVGMNGWIGLFYGGQLRYIGAGETTDRDIEFDTRCRVGSTMPPVHIDGGAVGGLRLEGQIRWNSWGNENDDRWLAQVVFTGSNASPCTVAGPYKMCFSSPVTGGDTKTFSYYTVKEGTGTWRFEENPETSYRGAFDLREGTLQFNSLAEKGTLCALGFGDLTTDGIVSKWDEARFCDVALRFGTAAQGTPPTFEFVGDVTGMSLSRKAVMNGDVRLCASGTSAAAPFILGGVTALATNSVEKTITLAGGNSGMNTLRDFSEESGSILSVVKEGEGTWYIDGERSFSGDLKVKGGRLVVRNGSVFRYFKIVFTDGYCHPNGIYVNELALYDVNGVRRNLGLRYDKPDTVEWAASYWPVDAVLTLEEGTLAWDSLGDNTYQAYTYQAAGSHLTNLCDGTVAPVQFVGGFPEGHAGTWKGVISMRLADDVPEIAYMDICQSTGQYQTSGTDKYQTASAFTLLGSADGVNWKTLVQQSGLPINTSGNQWYYSESKLTVSDCPGDRTLGNGEGLAFTERAVEIPKNGGIGNARSVEVAAGATLECDGMDEVAISRLTVDGTTGAGTIVGFRFADNIVVDVVNLPSDRVTAAVGFAGISNLADVTPTFLVDGEPSRLVVDLTASQLTVLPPGLKVIVR